MTIIFKDSEGDTITRVEEGAAITYHSRILINPDMFIKEGDHVMLFTKENPADFQRFYDEMINQAVDTARSCMDLLDKSENIIENLRNKNQQLTNEIHQLKKE